MGSRLPGFDADILLCPIPHSQPAAPRCPARWVSEAR